MALPTLTHPKHRLKIPSTKKQVTYRPFLVKEEKILLMALESQDEDQIVEAIRDIIYNCTFKKIDINHYPAFDAEYLLLQIRGKSVGEVLDLNFRCSSCEKAIVYKLDLSKIKVDFPKKEKNIDIGDNIIIELEYPTMENNFPTITAENVDEMFLAIAKCIQKLYSEEEVYDKEDYTPEEFVDFLDTLKPEQFNKILSFFNTQPALKEEIKLTCPYCKHKMETEIEGLIDFFIYASPTQA